MNLAPMIIDSFAGGGGASTGIENALGRSPDVAINHNAKALALHAVNHPDTVHLDSNIWNVKPLDVTKGRHVGLLWASPDCKHFSKAKGGAPRDRNIRDLAWIVVDWAEQAKPDVIAMENVEEFVTWGPVDNDGQPIKEFTGQTFDLWIGRLKRAGYRVQWRKLRACDFGAPTIRKRWFLIARRDGIPIRWPKPTHGDPKSREVKRGKLLAWRTAAECIDWALPCPSIFADSAEVMALHGLRAVRPLAVNTMARIARGMKRYVLDADRPFLVNVANSKTTGRGPNVWSLDEPARTVTSSSGFALVAPSITRFNSGATGQDMRDPLATVTANSWIKKPGGAAPLGLLTPFLATFYGHGDGRGVRSAGLTEPLRTVTVENRHALVAPMLTHLYTSNTAGGEGDPKKPMKTVTAGGQHIAVIAPVLTYAQQGGGNRSALDPHHTICASRKDQNSLIAAHLMTMRNAQKPFNGADEPAHTVTAGGAGLSTVAAFLAQQNGGPRMQVHAGHDMGKPISTIAASGSHQTPVAAWLAKWFSTPQDPRLDEPMHTVTTKPRFDVEVATLAAPPFSPEHEARARAVTTFLRAHDAWDGGEFVTLAIDGQTFVVVDIGMRMLTPRELFNAQGFPSDYIIEGVWEGIATGAPVFKPFAKDVQVSCCGNSVCPPLAEAIIRANCGHLAVSERIEATA